MLLTVFCSLSLMVLTVWFHATGLGFLRRNVLSHSVSHHLSLAAIVSTALVLHLIEICAYAGVIWLLNGVVTVGDIVGAREFADMDYFYFSAEPLPDSVLVTWQRPGDCGCSPQLNH